MLKNYKKIFNLYIKNSFTGSSEGAGSYNKDPDFKNEMKEIHDLFKDKVEKSWWFTKGWGDISKEELLSNYLGVKPESIEATPGSYGVIDKILSDFNNLMIKKKISEQDRKKLMISSLSQIKIDVKTALSSKGNKQIDENDALKALQSKVKPINEKVIDNYDKEKSLQKFIALIEKSTYTLEGQSFNEEESAAWKIEMKDRAKRSNEHWKKHMTTALGNKNFEVTGTKSYLSKHTEPKVTTEAKPEVVEPKKPKITTKAKPETVEPKKPKVTTKAKPETVELKKPKVTTKAKPETVEPKKSEVTTGAMEEIKAKIESKTTKIKKIKNGLKETKNKIKKTKATGTEKITVKEKSDKSEIKTYKTKKGDTLSSVTKAFLHKEVPYTMMMQEIYNSNRNKFQKDNMVAFREGVTIQIPSLNEIEKKIYKTSKNEKKPKVIENTKKAIVKKNKIEKKTISNKEVYKVKKGDSLWKIVENHFPTLTTPQVTNKVKQIIRANKLNSTGNIVPGQKISLSDQKITNLKNNNKTKKRFKPTIVNRKKRMSVNEASRLLGVKTELIKNVLKDTGNKNDDIDLEKAARLLKIDK